MSCKLYSYRHFFLLSKQINKKDVPVVKFMYLYLLACQVRVTLDDSGLCCCVCKCNVFQALLNKKITHTHTLLQHTFLTT